MISQPTKLGLEKNENIMIKLSLPEKLRITPHILEVNIQDVSEFHIVVWTKEDEGTDVALRLQGNVESSRARVVAHKSRHFGNIFQVHNLDARTSSLA
jgi:hypothetical protein